MFRRVARFSQPVVKPAVRPAQLRGGARGDHDESPRYARGDVVQQREHGPESEDKEERR